MTFISSRPVLPVLILAVAVICGCERRQAVTATPAPKLAPPLPVASPTPAPTPPLSRPAVLDITKMLLTTETKTLIIEAVSHVNEAAPDASGREIPLPVRVAIVQDAVTSLTAGLLADQSLTEAQRPIVEAFANSTRFVDRSRLSGVETDEQFRALLQHISEGLHELQIRLVEAVEQP
ncbi:MAG: hypothetical protein N2111_11495 [Candidatus Sumerlaeaceae bacterium]|nr:hypothetical protein [Candidatus Sumerlaeaceae bacterium]